jgi:hypothetical protein
MSSNAISVNKQRLTDTIRLLHETVPEELDEPTIRSEDEAMRYSMKMVEHAMYFSTIQQLKEFLVDKRCEGKKPEILVSSAYETEYGTTEDRVYLPYNEPKNHQVILDTIKQYKMVPENATISDYSFLFNFGDKK